MHEINEDLDMKARLDNLTHRVEILALGKRVNFVNQGQSEICSICASPMHTTQKCVLPQLVTLIFILSMQMH